MPNEEFPIMLPLLHALLVLVGIAVLAVGAHELWRKIASTRVRSRLPRARARRARG